MVRASITKGLLAGAALLAAASAHAADPASCKAVRFGTVGWADILATTAAASNVLRGLGYEPRSQLSSVPITLLGLKKKDVDVFLGNWMPAQESTIRPLLDEGSIETVHTNLEGAKFTLAVPRYVAEGGLRDYAELGKFRDKLGGKIYGIESGSDANRHVQDMIKDTGLDGFQVVVSSEAGMLAQVERALRRKDWIVFIGWEPHPMNTRFDLVYLSGGDRWFGANYGGATVNTVVRKGYLQQCPNLARFFRNLTFSLAMENEIMTTMERGVGAEKAAADWLKAHPEVLDRWLEGVTTLDGADGRVAVLKAL